MLGLPVGDSILCKLLLGLAVTVASCSNPIVAFTRSRNIKRAVSGSPLTGWGLRYTGQIIL